MSSPRLVSSRLTDTRMQQLDDELTGVCWTNEHGTGSGHIYKPQQTEHMESANYIVSTDTRQWTMKQHDKYGSLRRGGDMTNAGIYVIYE